MGNFIFLKKLYPELYEIGSFAEKYVNTDPNASLFKIRLLAEKIVNYMVSYDGLEQRLKNKTQFDKLNVLDREGILPKEIKNVFHILRKDGNEASHNGSGNSELSKGNLKLIHDLCIWFMEVYGDITFSGHEYVEPVEIYENNENNKEKEKLEEKIKKLEKELEEKLKEINSNGKSSNDRKRKAFERATYVSLNEAQTREIIDEQLKKVGWIVDSKNLTYAKGERPEKGKNKVISEWPIKPLNNRDRRADYALFIGEKLVGIIEAKREANDVSTLLDFQCKEYIKNIKEEHYEYCKNKTGKFFAPFILATNGRGYIEQFETKSGIWFQDLRYTTKAPKPLKGWISPLGIEEKLEENIEESNKMLENADEELLRDVDGLNLRQYQIDAIKKIEEAVIKGKDKILISMATGTGKTRTALGMIYRFLKHKRFRRILYLVDRTSLAEQTYDTFKDVKIEEFRSLAENYLVNNQKNKKVEKEVKVQISTVQGMVQKILYGGEEESLSVTDYDCIVVDEAHRGYTLDRELSEDEILYKDEQEYRSKYKAVIDYFDAVKIAITATPAIHTSEIFGHPIYTYSYREAVIDGYLVDGNVPHIIKTKLSTEGIKYKKGEKLSLFDPNTNEILNSSELEDEIVFGVEEFNKNVIAEDFNRVVLYEIFNVDSDGIDVFDDGKTLIFAVNDNHADLIVKILKEKFEEDGIPVDFVMKITGSIENGNSKNIQEVIKKFKNEEKPKIVVTVDLLTTGIDVPEITNLIFLRFVKSRILYEQMKGRATRLCPEINKSYFEIYDPIGVCEIMERETNMKPVVTNVKTTFEEIIDSLEVMPTEEKKKQQINLLIVKMRRALSKLDKIDKNRFKVMTNDTSPKEAIDKIQKLTENSVEEAIKYIGEIRNSFEFLKGREKKKQIVIYSGKDEIVEHTRNYEIAETANDYIEKFKEFLKKNKEQLQALKILATKPSDLRRKELKELKIILENNHFTEQQLRTAWNEMTNEDIVVDIIAWIRKELVGSPLIPIEKRVDEAIKKFKNNHKDLKASQEKWLERIATQVKKDYILNRETFESAAFKNIGGYKIINKQFNEKLEEVIEEINKYLYG